VFISEFLTFNLVQYIVLAKEMLQKTILRLKCIVQMMHFRSLSTNLKENLDKMQAWQIHSYNGLEDLRLSNVRIPMITNPTDVLVKIEATSVNPIDVAMTGISASLYIPANENGLKWIEIFFLSECVLNSKYFLWI